MAGQFQSHKANSASASPVGGGLGGLVAGWSLLAKDTWPNFGVGVPKLNLTTKETVQAIGSLRLFQRLRYHRWIMPLSTSRDALYPWRRILAAQEKMEKGDLPPLLPSEVRDLAKRQTERQSVA